MDEAKRARIGRLKWHCRRALLELDIVFTRFWELKGDDLDEHTESVLRRLLALEDHDVWDLVNGRAQIDDPELTEFAAMLRNTCVPEPVKH